MTTMGADRTTGWEIQPVERVPPIGVVPVSIHMTDTRCRGFGNELRRHRRPTI